MTEDELKQPATVFIGPGMEDLKALRDTRHFSNLRDAIIWAADETETERRWGTYIQTDSGEELDMNAIREVRKGIES